MYLTSTILPLAGLLQLAAAHPTGNHGYGVPVHPPFHNKTKDMIHPPHKNETEDEPTPLLKLEAEIEVELELKLGQHQIEIEFELEVSLELGPLGSMEPLKFDIDAELEVEVGSADEESEEEESEIEARWKPLNGLYPGHHGGYAPPPPSLPSNNTTTYDGTMHALPVLEPRAMSSITCSLGRLGNAEIFRQYFARHQNATYSIPALQHLTFHYGKQRFRVENHKLEDIVDMPVSDLQMVAETFSLVCPEECGRRSCWGRDGRYDNGIWYRVYSRLF